MKAKEYFWLKEQLIIAGYEHELNWILNIQPCDNATDFSSEAIWVILNSGMKEQIARQIWNKIQNAWNNNQSTSSAFGHKGKVEAIDYILRNCARLFESYLLSENKISFLQTIPFIGPITCYHLAKNLGHDVVKPDRHLVRIANYYRFPNCNEMCLSISKETGDKVSMIDMVLWRAANLGLI